MNQTPIIGITTYGRNTEGNFYLPGEYIDAVRAAGGVPILLSPGEIQIDKILNLMEGLIFAGGGDIEPTIYGGNSHPTVTGVDPERDAFELALAEKVLENSMPTLGICRGSQLLNIATGGNLIEHLPDEYRNEISHLSEEGESTEHAVQIQPGSQLAEIVGSTKLIVKSKHHQGMRKISEVWQVSVQAADGVIEALEHKTHPWMLAVLWHPEISLEEPQHQRIFKALVEAASNYQRGKL